MQQNQLNKTGFFQPSTESTQKLGYDFSTQNKIGKAGEAKIDLWVSFIGYSIEDVSKLPEYQNAGIDRLLTRPDGSITKAEYKTDIKAKQTGNLFFETVSVEQRKIPQLQLRRHFRLQVG